jgi:hypothetical protein
MKKSILSAVLVITTAIAMGQTKVKSNNGTEITINGKLVGSLTDRGWPKKVYAEVKNGILRISYVKTNQDESILADVKVIEQDIKSFRDFNGIVESTAFEDHGDFNGGKGFMAYCFFEAGKKGYKMYDYNSESGIKTEQDWSHVGYLELFSDTKQGVDEIVEMIKNNGYKGSVAKAEIHEVANYNSTATTSKSNNEKTDATIELKNKSKGSVNVMIQSSGGGSKTNFSINATTTERKRIKVGSSVYVNGNLSFTVTANMDGESKIIAQ